MSTSFASLLSIYTPQKIDKLADIMDMPGMNITPTTTTTMMMPMQMSFYWGKYATILVSGWPNGSIGMYLLALFFVFSLAAGVEVLSIITSFIRPGTTTKPAHGLGQSIIYVVQMSLAYMVMLSVMSFNVGVFIAAVLGHGLGHFIAKSRARAVMKKGEVGAADNSGYA